MSVSSLSAKIWAWVSHASTAVWLWQVTVGGLTAVAALVGLSNRHLLTALAGAVSAFAGGALVARLLFWVTQATRYYFWPPRTTLELYEGARLTLAVEHHGLPVSARVRAQVLEFGDDLERHDEPFDVHLRPKAHGGSFRSVELSEQSDLAKATLASLSRLNDRASDFRIHGPGMPDRGCVVQPGHDILLVLNTTLFLTTPLGTRKIEKQYKLTVNPDTIRVFR